MTWTVHAAAFTDAAAAAKIVIRLGYKSVNQTDFLSFSEPS